MLGRSDGAWKALKSSTDKKDFRFRGISLPFSNSPDGWLHNLVPVEAKNGSKYNLPALQKQLLQYVFQVLYAQRVMGKKDVTSAVGVGLLGQKCTGPETSIENLVTVMRVELKGIGEGPEMCWSPCTFEQAGAVAEKWASDVAGMAVMEGRQVEASNFLMMPPPGVTITPLPSTNNQVCKVSADDLERILPSKDWSCKFESDEACTEYVVKWINPLSSVGVTHATVTGLLALFHLIDSIGPLCLKRLVRGIKQVRNFGAVLIMADQGSTLRALEKATIEHAKVDGLWEAVSWLSDRSFFHGDIRGFNITYNASRKELVLIDIDECSSSPEERVKRDGHDGLAPYPEAFWLWCKQQEAAKAWSQLTGYQLLRIAVLYDLSCSSKVTDAVREHLRAISAVTEERPDLNLFMKSFDLWNEAKLLFTGTSSESSAA
eukprot:2100154-Amphidinium_carterae.1